MTIGLPDMLEILLVLRLLQAVPTDINLIKKTIVDMQNAKDGEAALKDALDTAEAVVKSLQQALAG